MEEKKERPSKRGRPAFEFTDEQIAELEKLSGLHCTRTEAAGWFDIDLRTLNKQFEQDERASMAWDSGLQKGKVSLRRVQFDLAKKNAAMAIWLGKQHLGQQDIVTVNHSKLEDASPDALRALQQALADYDGSGASGLSGGDGEGVVH